MKILVGIALSFISSLVSVTATADIIESVEYKYYKISPRSPHEIKPELMRRSPIREGGGTFNGHTDWYIDWRSQGIQGPQGCVARDIKTKVHVVHILPALSEYVSDKQTIDVFNKFNDALTKHEKNHGENGLSAAREIDKALSEIPPQPNCRYLSRIINDTGKAIIQKYIYADDEYDRTTNNGLTEGAVIY